MSRRANWSKAASGLLLLFAIVVQMRVGWRALGGDLAGADPPAHFTTGVLLYDYVKHFPPKPPLPFAECFYVRYPKVALGHWPPAFYVAECLWFLCFGAWADTARILCAALAACLAVLLWWHTSKHWGECTGLVGAAVLLTSPTMQSETWRVMSDIFLALLVYLALSRFADWMVHGTTRDLWWSALWTLIAILSKGTGWLLLLVVLAAPALAGRTERYRDRTYWLCVALPALAGAPFFIYSELLHIDYPVYFDRQMAALGKSGLTLLKPLGLLLIAGIAYVLSRWLIRKPVLYACLPFALWAAAQLSVRVLFPGITPEWGRFFIPCVAPALFLSAGVVSALVSRTEAGRLFGTMLVPIVGACLMVFFGLAPVHRVTGYAAAVDSIPIREAGPVIWIQSDAVGEGASIVRRLEKDHNRSAYMLRGSKMLSDSSWSGYGYRLLVETPERVGNLLDGIPVNFILFDTSVPATPDAQLVRSYLTSSGSKFVFRRAYPIRGRASGEIRIYERRSAQPPGTVTVNVILGPERLHRTISCRAQ